MRKINNSFWILCSLFLTAIIWQSATTNSQENNSTEIVGDNPMIGEITMFAGNFPPRGWAFCEGQVLPISSNQALASILGNKYGGDGTTTFGLPDLRNRVPIGAGTSTYSNRTVTLGSKKGNATLSTSTVTAVRAATSSTTSVYALEETTQTSNMQPYIKIGYIIALQGMYPSRS